MQPLTDVTVRVTGYVAEDGQNTILRGIVVTADVHPIGGPEVTFALETAAATVLLDVMRDGTEPTVVASVAAPVN